MYKQNVRFLASPEDTFPGGRLADRYSDNRANSVTQSSQAELGLSLATKQKLRVIYETHLNIVWYRAAIAVKNRLTKQCKQY